MGSPKFTYHDIPQIGKWIGRVSHVVDIMSTPCDVEPEVWVWAFWNATPHLLWSLFKPDTNDLVTKRWGAGHKKRTNKTWHTIEDIIADEPLPKGFGPAVFKLGQDAAQRVGWYMMVADATTDFLVHWTSTAYQWAGCRTPGAPYARSGATTGPYGSASDKDFIIGDWVVEATHILGADGTHIVSPGGYNCSAMVNIVLQDPGPPYPFIGGFTAELIDEVTGNVLDTMTSTTDFDGNHFGRMAFRAFETLTLPHSFKVRFMAGPGYYDWSRSKFQGYGNKDGGMLSDP